MERRKFMLGIGSLAAGGAAAMGTGAFTSVEAKRSLEVQTADDASALLGLTAGESGNEEYVEVTDGKISIDVSTGSNEGIGLNKDATTKIKDLFRIKNNGTQDVGVWMSGVPEGVVFSAHGTFANSSGDYQGFGKNDGGEFTEYRHFEDGDFKGGTGDPGVPVLKSGQMIQVELWRPGYGNPPEVDFSGNVVINAKDTDEI